jgi:hypothetical protein
VKRVAILLPVLLSVVLTASCKGDPPDNSDQGTVARVEHDSAHDTTTLTIDTNGGGQQYDKMPTSKHDWDDCTVGAVWPGCLKSWK